MTEVSDLSKKNTNEAIAFLRWLDADGLHNVVAIDPVTKAVEARTAHADELASWIESRNGQKNLYFSINSPAADARRDTKLRRDEIGAVRAFAVDLDELPPGYPWGDPCEDYQPSAVVNSGNGKWGFWKLTQPIPAEDTASIEAQNRALAAKFGADPVATNIDRIARLPGTVNIPNDAKRKKGRVESLATVERKSTLSYQPAEIAAWCPPAAIDAPPPKADQTVIAELDTPASVARAMRWLLQDAPEAVEGDSGNATTYAVAARLKDFGVSQQTAFDLLLDGWNEHKALPPWQPADLRTIVRNAFAYGSALPGRNSPALAETEFDAVEVDAAPKPKSRAMALEYAKDIEQDLKAASHYLIRDWYDQNSMIVTYGESNSGKTHVVLDQAMAIASNRPWAGHSVHSGLVVYVAAEGGFGVQRRIMAHRRARPEIDWKTVPFALIRHPIDLMRSAGDSKQLIALVKQAEADFGQKCVMVVIDTLSRALAGGDENSSADMGALVKRCDEIRAATGAALHIIHHAGKNTAKGARGHSLLRAAVDTEIEIENGAILSRKQRDAEAPAELRFAYKGVVLGEDADGNEVRSVVLDVWAMTEFDTGLTPQMQKVWDAAVAVVTQKIQNAGAENAGPETSFFSVREVESKCANEVSHATVDRSFSDLAEIGIFVKCKRGLYKLNRNLKTSDKPQA